MNDIINRSAEHLAEIQHDLIASHLRGKSVNTARAYAADFRAFGLFLSAPGAEAVEMLVTANKAEAFAVVLNWRNQMIEQGLSPATINRRLSALRSVVKLGRMSGVCDWSLEVDNVASESYRDTRGPGVKAIKRMLALAIKESARDYLMFRLLFDLGLRRSEVAGLRLIDICEVDDRIVLMVLGKGKRERVPMTLPDATVKALVGWLQERGQAPGNLFLGMKDHTVYDTVAKYAKRINVRCTPHGFRHTAITEAARITGGDVIKMKKFSRHANVNTLLKYVDNEADHALDISNALSKED